jgi:hypothetical protein
MYGPGDSDVFVMDMKIDAAENILLGGQSKSIQTDVGEGFVMLVDKFGETLFSQTYASGASAGDIVHKVAIMGTTYIAVGTSDSGSNAHFLLAFNATGSVVRNMVIATDTGKIPLSASITQFYMQGTEAHIVFDNSVVNIIDMAGATDDRYLGVSGQSGNIIRIVSHASHSWYSMFAVINGKIGVYWYDTLTTSVSKNIATDIQTLIDPTPALQTSDVDNDITPGFCWVAVYASVGNNYHAFHYTIHGETTYPTFTGGIIANLPFPPISLSIVYNSYTSYYLSAMLNNQQGSLYKVVGAVQTNVRVSTGLHGKYFFAAMTGAVVVTAGNKIGGESVSLNSSQAIIFKSDLDLGVVLYNCYPITVADTPTVAVYYVVAGTADVLAKTYITGTSAQIAGFTAPADSKDFPIRAESTKSDGNSKNCTLQAPTFEFSDETYSSSAEDVTNVKDMVTHCQGASMTFTPTVDGEAVEWAVGGSDSLIIKPSSVNATHCCNFGNEVSVDAYAQNSVPNVGTDTIDITFT